MLGLLNREASNRTPPPRKKPGVIVGIDGGKIKRDAGGKIISQVGGTPLTDRTQNPVIATGPMGRGKTQLLYATLMDADYGYTESCVLWDFKRVMAKEVGKAREALGQNVLVIDITKRGAGRVNPLQWIRKGDNFVSDCQLVATKMTERDLLQPGSNSAHWVNAAFSYMTGVIAYVMTACPDTEKNFAGVRRHMLRGDEGSREMSRPGICRLAVESAQELWSQGLVWEPDEDDPTASPDDSAGDKSAAYRKAIYTTCSAMLADFADDVLEAQTAVSDFDPTDLACGAKPLTVVISTNPGTARRLRRVFRLIFTQLIDRLTEEMDTVNGRRRIWDVLLAIDEFLEFGIQEVSSWVTYFREYGIKPLFLAQTFEDVVGMYRRVIASSAAWVAFSPMSIYEAELMSTMLGEVERVAESQSRTRKYIWDHATVTDSTRIEYRPERTPSDMLDMDIESLFIYGMGKAINASRIHAHCRYADRYGPAAHNWTATATANPWLGELVPVPERKPKEGEAADKNEAARKKNSDSRSISALLGGFEEREDA